MQKMLLSALLVFCFLSINNCGNKKEKPVLLKTNYSTKEVWTYGIEYQSQGIFTTKGSTTTMSTNIGGTLSANAKVNPGKLTITAGDIRISSDMLKDEEKQQLLQKIEQATYAVNINETYPSFDTAEVLPAVNYPEWDLYRQFAKLLPALPEQAVTRGFTWERALTMPVNTIHGRLPCDIYYNYKLDSLTDATASITWEFTYRADEPAPDSASITQLIPIAGMGSGSALLDTKNGMILKAEMKFKTPVATISDISVEWQEHAVLTYTPGK